MKVLAKAGSDNAAHPMLPPPASPSVSNSSVLGKRRRSQGSSQIDPHASAWLSAGGSFSESTKGHIETANGGDHCWTCHSEMNQICHVISKGSRRASLLLFRELGRRGLLSFENIHAAVNGISLCSNCHIQFDAHDFPGLVFFPIDLKYFFNFEEQDWERRQDQHDTSGQWPTRLVPTAGDYLQHQASTLPPDAVGGLYRRMFLRPFLVQEAGPVMGESAHYPPKSWHGCPLAALARAFHSLGTQSHLFPCKIKQQLRDLKDLYGLHDELAGINPSTQFRRRESTTLQHNIINPYPPTPQAEYHTADALQTLPLSPNMDAGIMTNTAQSQNRPAMRKRMREHTVETLSQLANVDHPTKRHHSGECMPWKWGPNGTSEEKAMFYRKIRRTVKRSIGSEGGHNSIATETGATVQLVPVRKVEEPELKQEKPGPDSVLPSPQASAG
ncbi:MAG: hypothetical protein Q9223_004207 [Gallowayella weberi]